MNKGTKSGDYNFAFLDEGLQAGDPAGGASCHCCAGIPGSLWLS